MSRQPWRTTRARALAVLVALATLVLAGPARAQEEPNSPRFTAPFTILQINDVYTTVPVDGVGGLARVATLKARIQAAGRTPLLMIAGDFLSPSVASSVFKGEQMVAALNAAGLDMATLGNHEFDFGTDVLLQRMAEAKWQWVISNVIDARTNKPVGNAAPYLVKTFGTLKVGFIGLCLTSDEISSDRLENLRLITPTEAAATYLPILKSEGANVIVALTHLSIGEDRALAQRFPEIDVIVGGHEHYPITAFENRTLISKAGSDARFVARIDVNLTNGSMGRYFELMPVTAAIPDEPKTAAVVSDYEARLGTAMDVVVGSSLVDLNSVDVQMRTSETNMGNFVADALRAEVGADVAIMNSGSIRGNRIYPAGPISRRTLVAIHPFGGVVCKLELTGRELLAALINGASGLPGTQGKFAQISGMTMALAPTAPVDQRVRTVMVGGQSLDLDKVYSVAVTDYQVKGGDGYTVFVGKPLLVGPESGPLLTTALEKYVAARGQVTPRVEGRITVVR